MSCQKASIEIYLTLLPGMFVSLALWPEFTSSPFPSKKVDFAHWFASI